MIDKCIYTKYDIKHVQIMNNFLGEMMKYKKTIATLAIAAAFGTGIVLADNNSWQGHLT